MTGLLAECVAALHLKSKGFYILQSRYKTQAGKIDIITRNTTKIVFAEVKFRQSESDAANYINYQKCKNVYLASECFLQDFPEFLKLVSLFKLFIITPNRMSIMDIF